MSSTVQSQAIATINQVISNASALIGLYNSMVVLDAAWTDDAVATTLSSMTTVPINGDGSLGTTADGSPIATHALSLVAYPGLARALTPNQITQIKTILDGIVSYVGGTTVATQASARPILNVAVGG